MQNQPKRGTRGRYVSAGAVFDREADLYIAREMPGSSRENLLDNAYETRYTESPEPVLAEKQQTVEKNSAVHMGPLDVLLREIRKDRTSAALCAILFVLFVGLGILYVSKTMQIRKDIQAIDVFRTNESFFMEKNVELERQLEQARSATRIRNQAQNNLGMLRREKADIREIYIQLPEDEEESKQNMQAETKFELLDALLNLIGIF